MPFTNSVIGGLGTLIRQMIQSPNYVQGSSGWIIRKDGSAEFNNAVFRGLLQAGAIQSGSVSGSTIGNCNLVGDNIADTDIVIDDTGGTILVYALTGQTVQSLSTPGAFGWTVPAGITSVKVECFGAGGGGGSAGIYTHVATSYRSGSGGGGGEYASESSFSVTPGDVIPYTVGAGGASETVGGDSFFGHSNEVRGHGGLAGARSGGSILGGSGSANSLHFNGGASAAPPSQTIGGGGGSSASALSSGNAANGSSGGTITNGGNGGNGSSGGAVGNNGANPGGGGGGASTNLAQGVVFAGGVGGNGMVRLTYGGTRTLIASIAGNSGTDKYGNPFVRGFRTNISTSAGLSGGYYEELALPSGQSIVNNGAFGTLIANATNKLISDYGSAYNFSTGLWTAPADGVYDVIVYTSLSGLYSSSGRGVLAFTQAVAGGGGTYQEDERNVIGAVGTYQAICPMAKFFTKGQTLSVSLFQNSGAAKTTLPGTITFIRRG